MLNKLKTYQTALSEKLNKRTQYGLLIIFAIIGFEAINRLDHYVDQKEKIMLQEQRKASRVAEKIDTDLWKKRAADSNSALIAQQAQFWQGDNPRTIAAKLQQDLERKINALKPKRIQVQVDATPVEINQQDWLRFSFSVNVQQSGKAAQIIGLLTSFQPVLLTDQLTLTFNRNDIIVMRVSGLAPMKQTAAEISQQQEKIGS